ncbi:MAG: hypothetical protein E7407_00815 [Ruminococcaceae bacterium]|nr:hypothetical protein [Oscillospiraceae bacterium]
MKKLLAALLISATLLSLCACAEKTNGAKDEETIQAQEEKTENDAETNNEASKKEVYWATENRETSDVSYHTKDCKLIKDSSPEVLPWEIVTALGMTACEKCNP